ncbi:Protein involved in initiation of plasmid replication (PDB:2Z9O) [Commensalibacter communis]|uniref:Protein involved in initiation of plasmid replication n=1 Tax=Commensalibacter communis TaxID=2972786 RepID=A0A9W4TQS1_9PROT|nr:replication initiation protein [Commensalibacter communis]CAI3959389.1 Protein involved in initiation of plasmid replication (PDB:2Z9O) [Commensalibacter communis]CAI3959508.1 Protein involved in initiation of plasmid replication (PDB:2Z9O) [Commensalibacter communis]CAI3960116.1 Protein involved in initiation of plasmid replication (PDB:2Z9O) [Commensalibacter communis]CAI3960298.1 Protein involved in initiation of plasmid replication (PDB:2Z9O) [Commensalibacter communis]CAI3960469.1 Prot
MKDLIVYKANVLIEASYKLTLQEQRILLICIAKLNPQEIKINKIFQITSQEFLNAFPNMGEKHAEERLQEAIDKLAERWIHISTKEEKRKIRWIQEEAKYFDKKGKVEIVFSDSIMPYLTQLKGQFTSIIIRNIASLKSNYSIRIYEILMQFKLIGSRTITIQKLRSMLEVEDKYATFKALNQWIIKPSLKELNDKSNLIITLKTIKEGRNVKALKFNFKEKV